MLTDGRWNSRLAIAFATIFFAVLISIVIYRQYTSVDKMELEVEYDDDETTTTQTSKPFEEKSTALQLRAAPNNVEIECVDYADKSYSEKVMVQCRQHTIEISEFGPDTLKVKVEQSLPNSALIWFGDKETNSVLDHELSADDIGCIMLSQEVNEIGDLTPDTTYTFCIFENTSTTVSPFDCVAYYLPPKYVAEADRPVWISKDDQTAVILIGSGAFVVFLWLGIMLGVWLIRRYPNWLKGAKNLIIVDSEGTSKGNGSVHRPSDQFSVEDNNSIVYRRFMDRRCFSSDNGKDYEIALNPSRFDIIKSRLEASQYEEKYYSEDVPKIAAPEPPTCASPSAPEDDVDDNNNTDLQMSLDDEHGCQRHSDGDLNLDAIYSKCKKIIN